MKRFEDLNRIEADMIQEEEQQKKKFVFLSPVVLIIVAVCLLSVLIVIIKLSLFPSMPEETLEADAPQTQPQYGVQAPDSGNASTSANFTFSISGGNSDAGTKSDEEYRLVPDDTVLMAGDADGLMVFNGYLARESVKKITFTDAFAEVPSNAWDISASQNGSIMAWVVKSGQYYELFIGSKSRIVANENCRGLFSGYTNLTSISFSSYFDTSAATDMSCMFKDCSKLKSLDLSLFDTTNVTTMEDMFAGCTRLAELNISGFDMSSVNNTQGMFEGCPAELAKSASAALGITPD